MCFFDKLYNLAKVTTDKSIMFTVLKLVINLIFIAKYNYFGLALQLLHVFNQQISFLVICDNERTDEFFILNIFANTFESKTFYVIAL